MFEEELDKIDKAVDEQNDEELQQSKNRMAEIHTAILAELDEVDAAIHVAESAVLKDTKDRLMREKRRCEEISKKIENAELLRAAPTTRHAQGGTI